MAGGARAPPPRHADGPDAAAARRRTGGGGGGGEGYYALWRIERVAEALRAVETARGWRRYCGVQRRDRVESLVFSGAYSRTPCIFVSGCEGSSMQYCVASQLRRVAQVRRKYNVVKPNHIISYRLACHPGSLSAFFASLSAHSRPSVCPSGGRHPPSDSASASPPLVGAASHSPSVCASPCLPSGNVCLSVSHHTCAAPPDDEAWSRTRADPTFAICV